MFTKKRIQEIANFCGGECNYSGKTKTMYIHHLKDRWTFNVCTAYLFGKINIIFQT